MSLINKVLADLDQRGAAANGDTNSESESALTGLPFTAVPQTVNKASRYLLISGVVVVLTISVGAAAYFYDKSEHKKVTNIVNTSEALDKQLVTRKPASIKIPNKPAVVSKVKPDVAIKAPPATVAVKPLETTTQQPPLRRDENKPKKQSLTIAKVNTQSGVKKNTIPLRSEQRAEVAYQLAYDQLKARNQRKAEQTLRQALAMEPSHIKSRELLSGVYIKQGRWVEASELLRKGLSLSPGHRTFSKLYARTLMQLKQDKLAISVLLQHAPSIESDPEYFAILAALYQRQKDHLSAAQTYQKIVKIQPLNGVWWVGLGISLEALGESKQASQAYYQARKSGNLQNEIARFTNNRLVVLDEIGYPEQ